MKIRHIMLITIFLLALSLRLYRFAHFHVLPESDVYYYINVFNDILAGGGFLQGFHPGFNAFMGLLGVATGLDFFTLFVYVGPFIGSLLIFAVYRLGKGMYGDNAGLFAAFIVAVTPLAIIRGGQTIAETLAFPFLVAYVLLLYDATKGVSKKTLVLIPLFVAMILIHNLTGAVAIFITLVGLLFYLLLNRDYRKAMVLCASLVFFISFIYFVPIDRLPTFKESYDRLYVSVKQYFSTFSYGADTSLPWDKFDMLAPAVFLGVPGLLLSLYRREKEDLFLLVLFGTLLSLTQLFRLEFNFLPHRFLIYLVIPLSLAGGRLLEALYDSIDIGKMKHSNLMLIVPLALITVSAVSFDYDFNFLISNEDFESLSWARENLDGSISTYSKINNTQNKYTAISDNDIVFSNSFFNTGIVDYSLLQIVSNSFGIPIGQVPPDGHTVYYTSVTKDHAGYVKLNKGDRCLTSINIIDTFWVSPGIIGICDGIDYADGVALARDYNLPVILYANERYTNVIAALDRWGCKIVLLDDIEVLKKAFDYRGMEYSYDIEEIHSYDPIENAYIYYDAYDPASIEMMVGQYLYLSLEAQTDFPDISAMCDETTMTKLYDAGGTEYYKNIEQK